MSMRRLASESYFYTREKQEVAFDWLDPDEREAERDFGGTMKENRVEPLCTQERVQQNSVDGQNITAEKTVADEVRSLMEKCPACCVAIGRNRSAQKVGVEEDWVDPKINDPKTRRS
ncbi:hypothetical protein TNCV_1243561 [Trichonephila clavipes]|nr:hypothetical protein TNCV_1243561 [Trichonephila clavipes]